MDTQQHVLIVEDEPKIAALLADFLHASNFSTTQVHDGAEVLGVFSELQPDFVLLDVMLPNIDGFTLCKEIRSHSDVPILFLTARIDEIDRLMGLGFGADDYVCKPFSAREVVARVQTILRRTQARNIRDGEQVKVFKTIKMDTERYECRVNENLIELTPVEFRLLLSLISKPGVVFSRDQLMTQCYADDRIVSDRTIDSHMKNLRRKLTDILGDGMPVQAVYGVGYKVT